MCGIMVSSTERAPASASCAITWNHSRRYHQGTTLVDDAIFLRQLLLHHGHANISDPVLYIRLSCKESTVRCWPISRAFVQLWQYRYHVL